VTTQVTNDLKTKLSYRYYDYSNQTPELNVANWVMADALAAVPAHANYAPVNTLSMGYIKQNGGGEVTWRPVNSVNLGAAYGWEHYDWTRTDASATNDNSAKVYGDWKPTTWVTTRASFAYDERRASNYNYPMNVGIFQWQSGAFPVSPNYSPYYRQLYLDDRDRAQAKFAVDVNVLRNLTITPTVNWQNNQYLFGQNQLGVTHDNSLAAGIEAAYVATSDLRFLFSYMNEARSQSIISASTQLAPYSATLAYAANALWSSNAADRVNTFVIGVNYAVIPKKFDVGVNYTASLGSTSDPIFFANGTIPTSGGYPSLNAAGVANPGQFPSVNSLFQRIEANAKYVVDPTFVTNLGLKGEVSLKLRYAWERNSVANWNNDTMQPYMYTALMNQPQAAYVQWMAGNNPNYNVHMLGGSVAWAW
jgi:hypothetical protein